MQIVINMIDRQSEVSCLLWVGLRLRETGLRLSDKLFRKTLSLLQNLAEFTTSTELFRAE
jgi:hypothetical protein